jgi:hypothetical protein
MLLASLVNIPRLVQALVLLSSFEQNIRRSMASLSSHALAVRTAYHLGLHAPSTYIHLGAGEKSLRARLWLAIVTQDRYGIFPVPKRDADSLTAPVEY